MIIILICVLVIIFVAAVVYHDMTHFVIRHYEITSDKIGKDVTFCLLSDLHEKSYGEHNCELVEAIKKENPDVILIAGDMITGHNSKHKTNCEPALSL
ncbi:MAG: metallophosphoesterase, partial [Butyrivibrio sp.]|nr:metallophosphoesterase [Butyrivibrio sp.]